MRAVLCAHPTLRGTSASAFACARRQQLHQRQRHIPRRPNRRDLCTAAASPYQRGVYAARAAHRRPAPSSSESFVSPPTLLFSRRMATDTTAAAASSPSQEPRFSPGSDEMALRRALQTLLLPGSAGGGGGSAGGRWALTAGGEGLERSFRFKTFAKTWDFMTAVALQCKIKNHHPEWSNVYNTTYIRWTTHSPRGLSAKDVELAAVCDALARDFGEVEVEVEVEAVEREKGAKEDSGGGSDKGSSCEMRRLADRGAATAGDCCGPRK